MTDKPGPRRAHAPTPLLLVGLLLGCGAASGPAREAEVHEGFARIQRAEARLDDAGRGIAGEDCAARRQRAAAAAAAAGEVCDTAQALQDADALQRCRRARERSEGVRAGVCNGDCDCGP